MRTIAGNMSDMEEEDYGFEYETDDDEEEDVAIENAYYAAKGLLHTDPAAALSGFEGVIELEGVPGGWGFKALKQIVKLHFRQGNYSAMLTRYSELLGYIRSAVTRNVSEKVINSILDYVSTAQSAQQVDLLHSFYETTLHALAQASNERLWFKTNLKLGKLWFDGGQYGRLAKVLKELHRSCIGEDGQDDQKKGTQLLEVFALEIQLYTATKNNKRLKTLYERALTVKSAIPHPRIMGVIRECGGKMRMRQREYEAAQSDFFEAFKNYDEAGVGKRIACLKYLVLANMLAVSDIDPFDSPEAKPYTSNPEIVSMTALRAAYSSKDIGEFERILATHHESIMGDAFVADHLAELLRTVRTQVLLRLLVGYTRMGLPYASKRLNVPEEELEALLVGLILDGKVNGKIDQVRREVVLEGEGAWDAKYKAIEAWGERVVELQAAVSAQLSV